jgi:hypothetical protein
VVASFSAERTSTDGGSVLLIPIDREMELTARVAATIVDERQAAKVTQQILALVRQRVFGIAAGCADGNDAARLADEPMLKLACERAPVTDPALASSRSERDRASRMRCARARCCRWEKNGRVACWHINRNAAAIVRRGGS